MVNPTEIPHWDAWVASLPNSTFFHSAGWCRLLNSTYGFTPAYFVREGNGPDALAIPMMEVDSWLTGRRGISLPFTDECAAAGNGSIDWETAFAAVREHAAQREWESVEFRGGDAIAAEAQPSLTFFSHRLPIDRDEKAQESLLHSATARAIRKAEKSRLSVQHSVSAEAMEVFYALLCKTRRRHGLPPQPFRFFENLQRHVLPGHGNITLAYLDRTPVAGVVFFRFGANAIYKFGASDERFQELRANNLVMWRAIRWQAERGCTSLDFGRTSAGNEGLRRFKLGWGAQERPVNYFKYHFGRREFVRSKDQAEGWHNHLFRLMPQALSRLVGAATYKHIA
jgi:hypothetical protein